MQLLMRIIFRQLWLLKLFLIWFVFLLLIVVSFDWRNSFLWKRAKLSFHLQRNWKLIGFVGVSLSQNNILTIFSLWWFLLIWLNISMYLWYGFISKLPFRRGYSSFFLGLFRACRNHNNRGFIMSENRSPIILLTKLSI
jgi:hypothetical protein